MDVKNSKIRSIRFADSDWTFIKFSCAALGVSLSQAVREGVVEWLKRKMKEAPNDRQV